MLEFLKQLFRWRPGQSSSTEEHWAEQARHSEERFRLLVESLRDHAILMLDPEGRVLTWNAGAERLQGYRAEEIIGQHCSCFYPPEAIEQGWPAEELRRAGAEGRFEGEGWRVRKGGSRFWASVVITAQRDKQGTLQGFAQVTRDLTERQQTEEKSRRLQQEVAARRAAEASAQEAQRAREQLQVTLTSIGDAVIVTDRTGAVSFMNPVAVALTGWEPGEVAGQPLEQVFRIVNEETRQPVENPVTRVLREGTVVGLANHTILLRKDGREIPIDDSGAPIRGEGGEIAGVVLVFRDVTAAHRALETRLLLAAIVESSDDAIISKDLQGTITSWNLGAERLYGYTAQEVIGRPLALLIPPDHPDEMPALLERISQGERIEHFETVRVRKDGSQVEVSLTISPIRNAHGRIIGASKIARDITAPRRAIQSLRESEARKAAILQMALDAIISIDSQGSILEFNPAAEQVFGHTRDEALGRPLADLILPPSLHERYYLGLAHYHATGQESVLNRRMEMLALRADGTEFPVEVAVARIPLDGPPTFTGFIRDVTDRKRYEEHLQSSEQRFRTLTSHAPVGIFQTDPAGNCLFVNEKWCKLAGMTPAEAQGQGWVKALHPEDCARVFREWYTAAQSGRDFACEYRFCTAAGKVSWVQGSAVALRNEAGEITGHIGTITDITELAEAEGRIRSVVNNVIDGIITIDAQGTVISLNPAAERIFGYPAAEVVGQNVKLLMPDPYHSQHDNYLTSYLHTGQARIIGTGREVVGQRKDGTTFPMDLAVGEFRLGQERYFTGVVRDITERKRVERSLRFLAETSATLAILVDYESTLQKVAGLAVPHFADWCAVDMVEPGGSFRRLAVVHSDPQRVKLAHDLQRRYPPDPDSRYGPPQVLRTGRSDMMSDIPDALLVQGARDKEHLRILREVGLKSYMCVPLQGRARLMGVITFVSAESGRRYTQDDLAFAEELARRAAIAIENAQLYAELREADRLKDEFLAMLAHELRNPLAPIRNALEIMKQPAVDATVLGQVRDMAERQVQHMARLLDDLLDISRISRGRIALRKEILDVTAVVSRSVEAVRPLYEQRQHQLTVSLPPESLWIEADPTRMEQVVTNLLNNAAKYTDPGGQVWLTAERESSEVVLRVRDTGIGIAPDMLPRIFEMFVQAERRLDRARGGLGIGLSLVRRLVEMHGGDITGHSAGLGQGSEFVVRLPALTEERKNAFLRHQNDPTHAATPPPPRRILVVDDNADAAESLAMLLRLEGHLVRTTHDGPTALLVAQSERPEMVILDLGMPGMDGYEVARRLRTLPGFTDVLLIALTGWAQEDDRRRCHEAGFDGHLPKPVELDSLRQFLAHPRFEKPGAPG